MTTKDRRAPSPYIILFFFILLKFVLQYLLINPAYDLHRDEYLHLDQANHLAAGYLSVPPVTSWISLLIKVLGGAFFWVKFFPALFGALTLVVVWLMVKELKGSLYAQVMAVTALCFSVLLRMNILFQPNSLDILCFTLIYYCLIKYINSENNRWLYYGAIVFALGFLNKYNILFLAAGLLLALLISAHRKIFENRHFYGAALLSLLLISPNLIWQYQNGFPIIHHMKELSSTQLVNVSRSQFILEQVLFFFNSIFLIILAFAGFFFYPAFKKYRLIFWSYVFTIAVFLFLKAKAYYAVGLYPVLLAFGSVYLEIFLQKRKTWWLRLALYVLVVGLYALTIRLAFPVLTPDQIEAKSKKFKSLGLLRWEDGKDHNLPQDFADMLGWKELAAKVKKVYDSLPDPASTLILAANYGEAGAIDYYTNYKLAAFSFSADYLHWFRNDIKYQSIIRIKEAGDPLSDLEKNNFRWQLVGKVENKYAREYGTCIFLLTDPKGSINEGIQKFIAMEEKKLRY
jgi:hypothetical protein